MRLCVALGFNLEDTLEKPIPPQIRVHMMSEPPRSHTEVELRRNLFWLAYCAERYHLFVSPWREYNPSMMFAVCLLTYKYCLIALTISDEDIKQTLPGTLQAFETGVSFILSLSPQTS